MRRFLYEKVSRKVRAAAMRADAVECARRGFPTIAEVLRDEAALLDPPEPVALDEYRGRNKREWRGDRRDRDRSRAA